MTKIDVSYIRSLDEKLVSVIRDFQFLTPLSWPMAAQKQFLESVERKKLVLPEVVYTKGNYGEKISVLSEFVAALEHENHPAISFIRENARSYLVAYNILQNAGTSTVTDLSKELYGSTDETLEYYNRNYVQIARYFLHVAEKYNKVEQDKFVATPYSAVQLRDILQEKIKDVIPGLSESVTVSVDENITARASAGPDYVKVRADAMFSDADVGQLLHHEVGVHTLTYINGRRQPLLKSLGYSSPRTTATQEGLATFSEYITYSIDLARLKRIALRIIAVDMALSGANLIDLFRFFCDHGQNSEESYYSAMRIFRGGHPKGGIVFMKDIVYLRGLFEVEGFLKKAMHKGDLREMAILFSGKLTTDDVHSLSPLVEDGILAVPVCLPEWMRKHGELATHLAINDLTERFKIRKKEAKK